MFNRFAWILFIIFLITSCSASASESKEDILVKTIVAQVNQELQTSPSATRSPKIQKTVPVETIEITPTLTISHTKASRPTPTPTIIIPNEDYGPTNFPKNINPLTGLPVQQPENLDRRPISIKVSNYPRGIRPQWGLSLADNVFEYYHEAGLTRFNAIFYSQDADQIGPIRSGRFSDEDIVNMYKAFFVFASADERVRKVFYESSFYERTASLSDYPCPPTVNNPLCRIETDTWNHLVANSTLLYKHFEKEGISNSRQNLDGFSFNPETPDGGIPIKKIIVRFSRGSYHKWTYDSTYSKYFRSEDVSDADPGQEVFSTSSDRLTQQAISADNVIIMFANYHYYSKDPEMVFIEFDGTGTAYGFRGGFAFPLHWENSDMNELLNFKSEGGTPYNLKPGNTWIVIIGSSSDLQTENQDWRFQFRIP